MNTFDTGIQQMHQHALLLAANALTKDWMTEPQRSLEQEGHIKSLFEQLLTQYEYYFQIRLLSPEGQELLRTERNHSEILSLPAKKLQNKLHRYYVSDALKIEPGEVYYSHIDLNVEHNEIEIPYKPTIRIATKVVSEQGKLLGLVVLNSDLRKLIARTTTQTLHHTLYICNKDGYFLYHPNAKYTFGFQLNNDYRRQTLLSEIDTFLRKSDAAETALILTSKSLALTESYQFGIPPHQHTLQFLQTSDKSVIRNKVISTGKGYVLSASLLMLAGLLAALLTSYFFNRRLYIVKKCVLDITEGNRNTITPNNYADEFGELLNTMNEMTAKIHQNEKDLRQKEERLRTILNTLLHGVITIDNKGRITDINDCGASNFGYSREQLLGKNVKLLMPNEEAENHDQHLKNYVRDGKPHIIMVPRDLQGKRKNGSTFPIQLSVSEFFLNGQQYFVGAIVDISDRKQYEKVLMKTNKELIKKNRDLENYAYAASHDLQEPIRKIASFINIINDTEAERISNNGKEILTRTRLCAERMQKLIHSLLELARISQPNEPYKNIALRKSAITIAYDLKSTFNDAIFHIGNLPTVSGVKIQIEQLLYNLIHNAVRFHKPGQSSEVTISELTHITNQSNTPDDDLVYFCIEDNGIGIDATQREKIFSAFVRLHSAEEYEGTGIGLTICRKIIEAHNGYIAIEASPMGGSRFIVGLPKPVKHNEHESSNS